MEFKYAFSVWTQADIKLSFNFFTICSWMISFHVYSNTAKMLNVVFVSALYRLVVAGILRGQQEEWGDAGGFQENSRKIEKVSNS
jgi:hypothetical protein